ncbi:MAG: peptide MFS transporter [Bacteroidia bacterium]|nr:peptide MFS transporter [Bacteroidia bacterium]MCF8427589.1 peptide MFS transporter [Bacteroidia bacterium]MCF8447235.1 peptide MFS transporter [Bacteroidia bacterium]
MARKHPIGLSYLFFTEFWERFGFYLMIGIFQLYLTDAMDNGGKGMDRKEAADIYGTFIAFVYLTPFLGGLLADRILGYKNAILFGGVLMGIGYLGLALPGMTSFYVSLGLIIFGNGFFKPNISTLLGNLYNDPQYKEKKDAGFNIFYMGINIGAAICNIFAAYMRNRYGWGYAFATAGIGMFIGVGVFLIGLRHYRHVDVIKAMQPEDTPLMRIISQVFLPAIAVGVGAWFLPGNLFGSDSTDAFIFASIPVIIFYVSLYVKASMEDKRPLAALLSIMAVSVMFWAVFKQNGTALTTWAQYYTDREMPAAIQPVATDLYLAEQVVYKDDSVTAYNDKFQVIKENGVAQKTFGKPVYFKNLNPEKLPAEGSTSYLFNTELFQSVNPFWVIVLTPVVVGFFGFLSRKKIQVSTATKIAFGLLITGLSTLVMAAAVYVGSNGTIKVSPMWLVSCYGVVTIGELFLSPMGLSLVSKLSPKRLTAVMMGGWFLATSLGNKLSGILATLWDGYENKANFFLVNCCLLLVAAIGLFLMLKWLNQILKEHL